MHVVIQRLGPLISGFNFGLGSGVETGGVGMGFGSGGGGEIGEKVGGGCHVDVAPFLWAGSVGDRMHMQVWVGEVCCRRGKEAGGEKAWGDEEGTAAARR